MYPAGSEAAARVMLERHREADLRQKEVQHITRLQTDSAQLRQWLALHPEDRKGSQGTIRKSNRSDNASAKACPELVEGMATSKGVSEQALLMPVIKSIQNALHSGQALITPTSLITADAGYHSEANLRQLAKLNVAALIADNGLRQRDERFVDQGKYQQNPDPLHDKSASNDKAKKPAARYRPADFHYDPQTHSCLCPAGKKLYGNGRHCIINGHVAVKFRGAQQDCVPCKQRDNCLRTPAKTRTRRVTFFQGKADGEERFTDTMKALIDSPEGRAKYGRRFTTVEPVFGNIRHNKQLNRFTLRGQKKVDAQWKLYCLVHNIEKLAHHGYGQ
ncbi:MAG: transposase [Porticoccaceae bacterium]